MNKKKVSLLSILCSVILLLIFGIINIVLDFTEVDKVVRLVINIIYIAVVIIDAIIWSLVIKKK